MATASKPRMELSKEKRDQRRQDCGETKVSEGIAEWQAEVATAAGVLSARRFERSSSGFR